MKLKYLTKEFDKSYIDVEEITSSLANEFENNLPDPLADNKIETRQNNIVENEKLEDLDNILSSLAEELNNSFPKPSVIISL